MVKLLNSAATLLPSLTADLVVLKTRDGGLGYRPITDRYLLLNSVNNSMRLALDYTDEMGNRIKGLWNSLSKVLGENSFDHARSNVCWEALHASNCSLGNDHKEQVIQVKGRYASLCRSLGREEATTGPFASEVVGFGSNVKKLHKCMQDVLRGLDRDLLVQNVTTLVPRDDQRAAAFLDAYEDKFSNAALLACFPDMPVSATEFHTLVERKLGLPLRALRAHVNDNIRISWRGRQRKVDAYGNQLQLAADAKGGHTPKLHSDTVRHFMQLANASSSIGIRGTTNGKNTFSKCLNPGADLTDENQHRLRQSCIPDGILDARTYASEGAFGDRLNWLAGNNTLVEFKTLARTDLSVSDRARQVQVDLDRKHVNLDNQNPGSTFVKTQKDFNNGKYLALVLGPFGQFSLHASDFVELIAQSRALLMMRHRKIKAGHAYGLCRAPVVSRIGLAGSLGWVRLILDRFRDAACPHPDSSSPFIDLGVDEFNFESFGSQRRCDRGFWRRC